MDDTIRRFARWLLVLVIGSNLLSVIRLVQVTGDAIATTSAVGAQAVEPSSPSPESPPVILPPVRDPHLPSLVVSLALDTDQLQIGDTTAVTLTVQNQAPDAADDLRIELPIPAGVQFMTDSRAAASPFIWTVGKLAGNTSVSLTASLRLVQAQQGNAVVLTPKATARSLPAPIQITGGALVISRLPGVANATFRAGARSTLVSRDGTVTVTFPPQASRQTLTLAHRTLAEAEPLLRQRGLRVPQGRAGNGHMFAPFVLEATDALGQDVHTFDAPVTLSVTYTPEQLAALNLSAASLTLFWYDETAGAGDRVPVAQTGRWVPLPTIVDPVARTATAQVDHFSGYTLADGSSPSSAYLPSLQGWQTSLFTGGASYSYPLDLPAGSGGLKPSLALSYSSDSTDGLEGMNARRQAGWVGRGWSLDTGSVALNKVGRDGMYYAVSFGGQSFDLVRAGALVGGANPTDPTQWDWRPTDENFVRVRAYTNGVSWDGPNNTPGRGGFITTTGGSETALPRYRWVIWTKDGTRYEFDEDLWWGYKTCNGQTEVSFNAYKWMLSRIVDPNDNQVTFFYNDPVYGGRQSVRGGLAECAGWPDRVRGTSDQDVWPTTITWGGNTAAGTADRFRVTFVSTARTVDTTFDDSAQDTLYEGAQSQPRETRRLNAIEVEAQTAQGWQRMRQYSFEYYNDRAVIGDNQQILYSDDWGCAPTCGPIASPEKLTLKRIVRRGSDGVSALPGLTFRYNNTIPGGYSSSNAPDGWQRLTMARAALSASRTSISPV